MSCVLADPALMTSAAADLAAIGSNVRAAHMVAAAPTTAVMPAAADEVSASIAHVFSQHAASYQALAGQAAAFQEQFVQHLTASAGTYASAEATNTALLRPLAATADSFVNTLGDSLNQQLQQLPQLEIELFNGAGAAILLLFTPAGWIVDVVILLLALYLLERFLGQFGL
jgi:PE family protein